MTTTKKVWLITGAGRGLGKDIARAALDAGHAVVATGRDAVKTEAALGRGTDLLAVKLDVTNPEDSEEAVRATMQRFGRIDVLVNNAASFYAGYFEELSPTQMNAQLATSLLGPMHVTRAVLPILRAQRSGHVMTISSSAGLAGFEFCSAYSASKFGLEGWMQALEAEVAPFGIHTTVVNPGFFRTELLTGQSTTLAEGAIDDYSERRTAQIAFWKSQNGKQGGDPAKLARALVAVAAVSPPPLRFVAGADAMGTVEQSIAALRKQTDAFRELSASLALDEAR